MCFVHSWLNNLIQNGLANKTAGYGNDNELFYWTVCG